MIELSGWIVLNFFTSFLLIILLIFQKRTSRLQKARKYSAILICTLILLASETIGRIGEYHPEHFLFLAKIGYFLIFLLDPVDLLFAVSYIDCWMERESSPARVCFKFAFQVFAVVNGIMVTASALFRLKWFYFFYDNVYYRGLFFYERAMTLMFFIVMLMVYAIVFRKDFMSEYKNTVLCLPLFSFIGALLQVFISNIDCTYAGISLGCLVLFFYFQSNDINVDYLTGVLNRRGLDIRMEYRIKNSQSGGKDFTAIMMDLDNFKTINDTFGHEEGDKAIKIMAEILDETFGEGVTIGRFGGDEFCVITDITSRDEIDKKIDEIHTRLEAVRKKRGWNKNVNLSCGYEVYDHSCNMTREKFAKTIDSLMYREKQIHHGEKTENTAISQ
jgi:diguanylate cyclase (GGDEF)-like protein